MPIDADIAAFRITAGTFRVAGLTISELSSVAPKGTIVVVPGKENALGPSAGKAYRCHLVTSIPGVARRTQAFPIEANSVPVAFLGASFDCTGSDEGSRAR